MAAVAARHEEFEALDAQILSVSTDSPFVHKMWNDNELSKITGSAIPFPMLTDRGGRIGSLYGIYDEGAGVDLRGRFIIDPDGIIQAFECMTPPVGRNVLEGLRQLKAFQLVRKTKGGEVTPAGWEPGKTTLKPGIDLVGNVWKAWKLDPK